MTLPYRTRRALQRLATAVLVLILAAVVVWLCWILWLERFVIYTEDGARLDFSLSDEFFGEIAKPPEPGETVDFYVEETVKEEVIIDTSLAPFSGYYAMRDDMMDNPALLRAQIEKIPDGSALMIDVKSIWGYFYYTSSVGPETSDTAFLTQVNELMAYLQTRNLYLIARLPAFQEYYYPLNNTRYGLYVPSGGYLWMDNYGCYWLNPQSEGTITYLIQIITELRNMGFDEVLFFQFRFPDTDNIRFYDDREAALANAADQLVKACATDAFTVSFEVDSIHFRLPEGRTRMYLSGYNASDLRDAAEQSGMEDPHAHMVFYTDSKDTRFEDFGVLRPLLSTEFE